MSQWHDSSCRRLDVFTSGGISSCLSCGSVQSGPDPCPSSCDDGNIHGDIYQTLENKTDMRLLVLEGGRYDDPIRGRLRVKTISGFLEYDAISYTWAGEDGNTERSGHIILNSQRLSVTSNCEAALRRARRWSGPRTIWIDAICINQEDPRERGHQVRLMQKIYSYADCVLIYLGEPIQEEEELLVFISGQEESLSRDKDLIQRLRKAQCQLFGRRYFSRVWVIQEVALARRVTLICGKHSIPWSLMQIQRLGRLLGGSTGPEHRLELDGPGRLPAVLNFHQTSYRDSSELLSLLDVARSFQASDPRDKVFALLGLLFCPEFDGLVADYTKTTAEVYTSIAIWIAQTFGLHQMLIRSWGQRLSPVEQLPRWAPNWAHRNFQERSLMVFRSRFLRRFSRKPAKPLAVKLPITMCERDMAAIRFPAFLLRTAGELLWPGDKSHYFFSSYSNYGFGPPTGCAFTDLNSRMDGHKADDGKAAETNASNSSVTVENSLTINEQIRDLVYLIPEPHKSGFDFTEPGLVSVSDDGEYDPEPKRWTHENGEGKVTTGSFSSLAICCSERREGNNTRIYVHGLLEHREIRGLKPGKFEFVSAR